MGMNAWREKPWGDFGKQTWKVRTWHVGADCSKYGQQKQGRSDHLLITYGGQPCTEISLERLLVESLKLQDHRRLMVSYHIIIS